MQVANSKNFVSMLSEEKPVMCFFHSKSEDYKVKKIKESLLKLKKNYPLLPLYEYIIDESSDNKQLCEIVGIVSDPVLVVYKNGNFSRYKDKNFSDNSIAEFIGSKKQYALPEKKAQVMPDIEVDMK